MALPKLTRPVQVPAIPKAVPLWIRDEFIRFSALAAHTELLEALRAPMKVSDKTWNAIARYEKKHHAAKGLTEEETQTQSLLLPLARFLNRGVSEFTGEAKLTVKERRRIADRLQKLSRALDNELTRFEDPSIDWVLSRKFCQLEVLREQLSKLIEAAERWKIQQVAMHRPTDANANRTYFMRVLSDGFLGRYGKPLNEPVLEFTSVFFECTDKLDISGVAKRLKPQRKRSKT